jgi:hypothetical protein
MKEGPRGMRRTARGPLEVLLGIACAAALTLGVSACKRARIEKPAAPAAADARQDEGTVPAPNATAPANPAVAQSGWAIATSQNTEKDMQAAEAAVRESLAIKELPRLKGGLISAVRRYLQYPDSAVFRGEHLNVAHTALCGEVDYEQWKDGASGRSGFRAFVATPEGIGAVDTDYPGMHERYQDAAARIDCTPDLNY